MTKRTFSALLPLIGHALWVVLYPDFASAEGTFAGTLFTVSGFILWLRICNICGEWANQKTND